MFESTRKLVAARTRLILDKPFLGALVLRLPLRAASGTWCTTTATDAKALYYNPKYISSLRMAEVQFVLAHEALHCALSHFARREHRNRQRWDIACDHAVNQMLIKDKLAAPSTALLDDSFAGMTAEEIYPLIPEDSDEVPQDQHLYDGADSGNAEPLQTDYSNEASATAEIASGSAVPPPPLTAQEREQLHTQWQQRLAGAAQQASQAGKMSESGARLVKRLLNSTIPWRTLLARFMGNSSRTDYTLMRPSQRRAGDAIHPSLYIATTDVIVALDTSGSIEESELNSFCTEVNAIKGLVNARITLLACDAELDPQGPWVFEPWEKLILPKSFSGNGGTDFTPVFDWLCSQQIKPDLLVYFTDANGRFPAQRPTIETLWLVKGSAKIPWGQRIQLN